MTTYRMGRDLLAAGLMLSVLAGCGGGGGDDSPPPAAPNPPPPPPPPPPPAVPAPGPGVTSGDTFAITSTGRLVTFDRADPALDTAIAISGLQTGETVVGLDIRAGGATPGELYALGSTGRLYTVNTTTGVATLKSTLAADPADTTDAFTALSGTEFGVDFNPVADRLRVVSDTGQNLRIDADTGLTFTDTALSTGGTARSGVNGAAYTNAFAAACRTTLYYIDSTTDQLLTTSDPNGGMVTVVGPLGVDATAVGDFEIATAADGTNTGYAVLVVGNVPTSYQINLSSGTAATAGAVTRLDASELVRDTTIAPPSTAPTQTAGDVFALTETSKLVSFNSTLPQKVCTSATLTGQQSGETIVGIDVRPADAAMYALGSTGRLYTVDTATAALTLKSTLFASLSDGTAPYAGLLGTEFGVDFNPGNDLVRVVSDTGQNFRVTPDDGAVITDVDLNPVGPVPGAAAYGNSFVGVNVSFYYTIDSASDALQVVGRPSGNAILGDTQAVGALGVDVSSMAGFDILGINNQGLAAVNVAGATTSDLYTVNLTTGAATRVNTVGGGERIRGLAYGRVPVATVFALTADNHLVSFKPLTPGTFDTDVAITGLTGAEAIVALDVRPSNGTLYALTDAGRVYTVDTATGALAGAVTLTANTLDTTAPFTALSGTRFGADFSPLDGQLRVQSDTGQNLRVDVDAGTVITDGALNPGTPQVVGTAFSNSYAGAVTSNQYALDLASGTLVRQTSVSGALTTIGAFNAGTTFMLEGGFDIAGSDNGLSIAALQPTGATQSTLYRVGLGNGALTSLGLLGSGTTVIKALAIRLQ
jgi:trimeric autotransporter adhesin